jgi:predicted nucleotidyltransferase
MPAGRGEKRKNAPFMDKIPFIISTILSNVYVDVIQKVYLFGSYANGNPDDSSDIDLFMIVDDDANRLEIYASTKKRLRDNGIIPCDLIVSREKEFNRGLAISPRGIENTVKSSGKILYER